MRITHLFIAALLLISSCDRPTSTAATPAANPHTVSFLALGDSYTIGESVAPSDRWPMQLARLLRARGVDVADPTIIARTGWTTGELSVAIDDANPKGPFDLVGLLIGVNDQYRGGTADEYRPHFVALLERSIAFANAKPAHVVVLSIPDWGVMPFAAGQSRAKIGHEIDAFNSVARDECSKHGVMYVDVTAASREAATQPSLGAPDGLHPSGQQYARWAKLADDALRAAGQ